MQVHVLLFSPPGCVRSCRLGTASRDNQVRPKVFEMFNIARSSAPLSFAEHGFHQLPVYVCQCARARTHTHAHTQTQTNTGSDLLSWEQHVEPLSLQTPLGYPVNALWCVAFHTVYGWMCVSVVRCFSLCFALEFPLTAGWTLFVCVLHSWDSSRSFCVG